MRGKLTTWANDTGVFASVQYGGTREKDRVEARVAALPPVMDAGLAALSGSLLDQDQRYALTKPWRSAVSGQWSRPMGSSTRRAPRPAPGAPGTPGTTDPPTRRRSRPDTRQRRPASAVTDGPGPLAGLVVCDLSTVLAGPYCAMLLADLGAEVIKVEPPDGDPTRRYGPPYAGAAAPGATYAPSDPRADPAYDGESAYFLSINRNKRDIALDLRKEAGRGVLHRLLARSDVLIENMRAGSFERLGFDDAELERLNPRLVRLSITGYGTTGPDRDRPGFDFIIQAVSGLMSITGGTDADGGEPTKVGVAIADIATGMLGAVSVLAALRARDEGPEGPARGRGQRIDLSLLDATLAWLINQAANHLVGGTVPGRMGNQHPNITPYETFRTSDGELAVAVGSERQWARFCQALGIAALATRRALRQQRRAGPQPRPAASAAGRCLRDPPQRGVAGGLDGRRRAGRRGA